MGKSPRAYWFSIQSSKAQNQFKSFRYGNWHLTVSAKSKSIGEGTLQRMADQRKLSISKKLILIYKLGI